MCLCVCMRIRRHETHFVLLALDAQIARFGSTWKVGPLVCVCIPPKEEQGIGHG